MKGARIRLMLVLALLFSTLAVVAGTAAQGGGGGDAGALAYASFNNPEYSYDILVQATTASYRAAGFRSDGSKIVAEKQWSSGGYTRREVVLLNADGTGEITISPGDSGQYYRYGRPFWSDDGTAVGYALYNMTTEQNTVVRYDLGTTPGTYVVVYQPPPGLDANNVDFLGDSKTAIVFWDWIEADGAADHLVDL